MAINTDPWLVMVQRKRDCDVLSFKCNTHVIARNFSDKMLSTDCNISACVRSHHFRVKATTEKENRTHHGYPQMGILLKAMHLACFSSISGGRNTPARKRNTPELLLPMTISSTARKVSIVYQSEFPFIFKTSLWETQEEGSMKTSCSY